MQSAIPGQRYILRHVVKYPSHIDHQDQTIEDHTWAPREELLGHGQSYERCQVSRWMAIVHHAGKIFPTQPIITFNLAEQKRTQNLISKNTSYVPFSRMLINIKSQ